MSGNPTGGGDPIHEPVVRIDSAVKEHRDGRSIIRALNAVSLDVPAGEMVAVTGKSGSGKSTLLNVVGGLEPLTAGSISVLGGPLVALNRTELSRLRRRTIGFVFQNLNLVPSLTAEENVALPLEFDGAKPVEASRAAKVALDKIRIGELATRFPSELSGGEKQRVAIARAIVGERKVILADEPTAALDDLTSRIVMNLLAELSDDGLTVLVATHDSEFAAYADRVVRLKDGSIEHVSSRPVTPSSPAELLT